MCFYGPHYFQRLGNGPNNILALCSNGIYYILSKRRNIIHVDFLEEVTQTIYIKKLLSGKNMFNSAGYLTCQTL